MKTKTKSKPKKPKDPGYRKQSGANGDRAFVALPDPGRTQPVRVYLGEYGSAESWAEYHKVVGKWHENNRRVPSAAPVETSDYTVVELCDEFLVHAEEHYRKDGASTSTLWNYKAAMRFLTKLYASTPVAEFTILSLERVRLAMIEAGWCRGTINQSIHLARAIFRWGVTKRKVPGSVFGELKALPALEEGRKENLREGKGVTTVSDEIINLTMPHLSETVRNMVRIHQVTGMRPAEVCLVRTCDITKTKGSWEYRPAHHKNKWRGKSRVVFIGAQGQAILEPLLKPKLDAYIFSAAESSMEHLDRRNEARKTPEGQGNVPGSNRVRKPERKPGERFSANTYRRAIERACLKAWPVPEEIKDKPEEVRQWIRDHRWAPNQIRHNFATQVKRAHGADAARLLLGHSAASGITAVYIEEDFSRAREVARLIG